MQVEFHTVKSDIEHFKPFPLPKELLATLEKGTGKVIVASSHENEYSYTDKTKSVFIACLMMPLMEKIHEVKTGLYVFWKY